MYYLPYNRNLKTFSRQLRNNSTKGEIALWKKLRAGAIYGYTFNRQKPLDRYIVDFYCKPINLVIEVDEIYHTHSEQKIKDKERQEILEKMGLCFLRFTDDEVFNSVDSAIEKIKNYAIEYETSHPGLKIPVRRKSPIEITKNKKETDPKDQSLQ